VQQNSVFNVNTVFPHEEADERFTNPTSTVQLQLLTLITESNAKRRKVGVMMIELGRLMTGMT
jgi:hypothetical protein